MISAGDTVVEYTGGSTGPALALVCRTKGYRPLIVIADCFTEERFQLMRALRRARRHPIGGGPADGDRKDIENMVARAAEPARAGPPTRPTSSTTRTSFPTTATGSAGDLGPTEGRVTAFCHGMGTAKPVMGVSDALKPHGVFIQAHEPASSAAISGGERGSFLLQGWTGLVMPHWNAAKVDHLEPIEDDEAVEMNAPLSQRKKGSAGHFDGRKRRRGHRLAERLGQTLGSSRWPSTAAWYMRSARSPAWADAALCEAPA